MKKTTKRLAAFAGTAALYGIAAYGTTKLLADIAMKREQPHLPKISSGSCLTGEAPNDAFRAVQKMSAQRLATSPNQTVSIQSQDGLTLVGHWFECPDAERIIIAFHGWRSAWYRDFGMISDFWRNEKCSVLYVEQRAQRESEGKYIGFGLTECNDCLDWTRWVIGQFGTKLPIYLAGVSMGATTVLMAAGLELPEAVHGIIADSAYTSPHDIWKHVARKNLHLPFVLGTAVADQICRKRLSVGSNEYSTVQALSVTDKPVLLIHGEDDHFVPVRMAYENYNACQSPCQLLVVPGADHVMSYYTEPQKYEGAISRFWKEFDWYYRKKEKENDLSRYL